MKQNFRFINLVLIIVFLFGANAFGQEQSGLKKGTNPDKTRNEVLFNNGPIANSIGSGPNGSDVSIMPSILHNAGYTTSKVNTSGFEYRVADDFIVDAPMWQIDSIEFFGFTGSDALDQVFDKYTIQIWQGEPGDPTSRLIWGDEVTNRVMGSKFSGVYREYASGYYPIISNMCSVSGLVLPEGHFWIDWNARAVPNSAEALTPPVVKGNEVWFGNARSAMSHEWIDIEDTYFSQALPFVIYGSAVKDPKDVAAAGITSALYGNYTGSAETVQVKIKNNGLENLEQFEIKFFLNENLVATESLSQFLAPGEEYVYQSTVVMDFQQNASNRIKVVVSTPGETYTRNNATEAIVIRYGQAINMSNNSLNLDYSFFFDDGGFAGNHGNGANYVLTVRPQTQSAQSKMSIEFFDLDLYYASSCLKVYNGLSNDYNNLIASISTGFIYDSLRVITSTDTTGALTFEFISNDLETRPGWVACLKTIMPLEHDLKLAAVNIPEHIAYNQDFPCEVEIMNEGTQASGAFQIIIYDDNNEILDSQQANHLQAGQSISFTSVLNLSENQTRFLRAVVKYDTDMNVANNVSENFYLEFSGADNGLLTVGTPDFKSNKIPVSMSSYTSICEMLYYPEELIQGMSITDIAYQYCFEHKVYSTDVKVWIGETDQDSLTGNYINPSELTLVFDGSVSMEKGTGNMHITFSQPYEYTGRNLVVAIYRPYEEWSSSLNNYYASHCPEREGRTIVASHQTMYVNLDEPRYLKSSDILPYTKFYYQKSSMGSVKGIVEDLNNEPLSKATITLTIDGSQTITTGSNGLYWMQNLEPGTYIAKTNCHGYSEVNNTIEVVAGEVTNLNTQMSIAPTYYVSCMVRKFHYPAEPATNVKFEFTSCDTTFTAINDNTGLLLVPNVPSNVSYQITASSDGYKTEKFTIFLDGSTAAIPNLMLKERTDAVKTVTAEVVEDDVLVSWQEASSQYEIAYDNGEVYGRTAGGISFAVRFTPQSYPCSLVKARINLYEDNILSPAVPVGFVVNIWDDNGADGLPGTLLYAENVQPSEYGWFELNIPNLNIIEGDFYISILRSSTVDEVYLSVDNQTATHSYIQNWDGAIWKPYSTYSYGKNFMIRAVVDGAGGSKELEAKDNNSSVEGYNIYRFAASDEFNENNWQLLAENHDGVSYSDTLWVELPFGQYKYAVKSYYTMGNLADASISNVIEKDMTVSSVQLQLLPFNGQAFNQTGIILLPENNDLAYYYNATTNSTGLATISNVRRGNYYVKLNDRRFITQNELVAVSDGQLIEVGLLNKPFEPMFVEASLEGESVEVEWQNPSNLYKLSYDDGNSEWGVSGGQANPVWIGNKFSANSGSIVAIEFLSEKNPETVIEPLSVDIFNAEKVLIATSEPFEMVPDAWNYVTFSNSVAISGEFYAMVHFASPQTPQHYLAVDTDGAEALLNRAYHYNGSEWESIDSYYSTTVPACNVMLRVLMEPAPGSPSVMNTPYLFDVYRFEKKHAANINEWESVGNDINGTAFNDASWSSLGWGEYMYAVQASSLSDLKSRTILSNPLDCDMNLDCELVILTNSNYIPEDILVNLVNIENPEYNYTISADENGVAVVDAIRRGIYQLKASHRNFVDYTDTIDFQENASATITLTERALAAGGVKATIVNPEKAGVSWSDPNSIISLAYDDGTSETGITPYGNDNLWLGNGYNLPVSVTVESVDVYSMANIEGVDGPMTIDIYNESLELIYTSEAFYFEDNDWVNVPIPSFAVNGGVIFAMVHWINLPAETNYLGIDQNGPNASSNASVSFNGVAWAYTSNVFEGVIMVRVNVLANSKSITLEPVDFPLGYQVPGAEFGFSKADASVTAPVHDIEFPDQTTTESVAIYNVYRLKSGQENNFESWVQVAEELDAIGFEDMQWGELETASYKYAVEAIYPSGVSSRYVMSNEIVQNGYTYYNVTFSIKDEDANNITDAIVEFNDITHTAGYYFYQYVLPGTYSYTITKDGYFNVNGSANVNDDNLTVDVVMEIDDTRIDSPNDLSLSVYPNPASESVRITSSEQILEVQIVDLLGKEVYASSVKNDYFDLKLDNIQSGSYLIRIISRSGIRTEKLSIVK